MSMRIQFLPLIRGNQSVLRPTSEGLQKNRNLRAGKDSEKK